MSAASATAADGAPVWFITGCSTGFGRHLAEHLLAAGKRVVVTARRPEDVADLASKGDALVLRLDVTDHAQIAVAVATAEKQFGRIDVLVNNAGIGYFGALEESDPAKVHRMFDINVFGLAEVTRAVLPGMRARRSGAIVNFSSIGGLCAFPGLSWYNASKFAVEALSESLWQEVEPLGLKVMLVEPSGFRTDWAGRSADEATDLIDDYAGTAHKNLQRIRAYSGQQPGDPVRAAQAILAAIDGGEPPHRLLLGNWAYDTAIAKLDTLKAEFGALESIARGADFPK